MKVLVTGARGMLGTSVCREAVPSDVELYAADLVEAPLCFDITRPDDVRAAMASIRPDIVLHCAAYTQVDQAESDPQSVFRVNALGTELIAREADAISAALCYVSTDFVFDGTKGAPYHEYDEPRPISAYGASKLAGEHAVLRFCRRHWIVRTAWLYGEHGRCFPATILRAAQQGKPLRVVADQTGSPTYAFDLARTIWHLVRHAGYGIYHVVNSGTATWYELACRTLSIAGLGSAAVQPIPSSDWPSPARRPARSALISLRASAEGLPPMRPWADALEAFIINMKKDIV